MRAAERYAAWCAEGRSLREETLLRVPRRLDELELQAHWFAGDFGREFTTTTGDRVRVVQFGVWNREAGPDFAEAAVVMNDDVRLRGCIELDPDARDWERHGHSTNSDYDSVVLHVFAQCGSAEFFTRTSQHRLVPQVLLDLGKLTDEPPNPQPAAKPGRCVAPLGELAEEKVRDVLLAAAQHRLRRKAAAHARLVDLRGEDEALYQALAAALGYRNNKLPFTTLAQRLPLRALRASGAETTALLFGVSGFLQTPDLAAFPEETRGYLRELWEGWWSVRGEFQRLELSPRVWKVSGQRPANHPQRRLAALAEVVRHWRKFRAVAHGAEPAKVRAFFRELRNPYWDFHYTLTSPASVTRMALVGDSRVTEILANVLLPRACAQEEKHWETFQKLPGAPPSRRVKIAAMRLFGSSVRARTLLKSAAIQQGLLQVYEDFCMQDASDCAQCRFPQQLLRW